jgi:hypothetical protein
MFSIGADTFSAATPNPACTIAKSPPQEPFFPRSFYIRFPKITLFPHIGLSSLTQQYYNVYRYQQLSWLTAKLVFGIPPVLGSTGNLPETGSRNKAGRCVSAGPAQQNSSAFLTNLGTQLNFARFTRPGLEP